MLLAGIALFFAVIEIFSFCFTIELSFSHSLQSLGRRIKGEKAPFLPVLEVLLPAKSFF
jgi:hypothetical protein